MRSLRLVVCLALGTMLSACITTQQAVSRIWGSENELLVRAVASIDHAWFVEGRGLVLSGEVTPGRLLGDPIRLDPNDDPPTAPYVAALTLNELASRRPRLHYSRFRRAEFADVERCLGRFARVQPRTVKAPAGDERQVALVDLREGPLRELLLEDQRVLVAPLGGIPYVYPVALGPRGGDWLYALAIPFTVVGDAGRLAYSLIRSEPPEVSAAPDADFCKLFPREVAAPWWYPTTWLGAPK